MMTLLIHVVRQVSARTRQNIYMGLLGQKKTYFDIYTGGGGGGGDGGQLMIRFTYDRAVVDTFASKEAGNRLMTRRVVAAGYQNKHPHRQLANVFVVLYCIM